MIFNNKHIADIFSKIKSLISNLKSKIQSMLNVKDSHSRLVAWLKLTIPSVIAISIGFFIIFLSFDFSDAIKISIPMFDKKKPMIFKIQSLTLSYMDSKNNLTTMFLKEAEEIPNENKINVSDIDTKIEFNTSEWIDIKSKNAIIDKTTSEVELQNNVVITDYKGDILKGKNIKLNIKESTATSSDPVDIKSFMGDISSTDGFYMKQNEMYKFKGKVKAKIDPNMFKKNVDMPFKNIELDSSISVKKIKSETRPDNKKKKLHITDKQVEKDVKEIIKIVN